jgi:hypothetical protein
MQDGIIEMTIDKLKPGSSLHLLISSNEQMAKLGFAASDKKDLTIKDFALGNSKTPEQIASAWAQDVISNPEDHALDFYDEEVTESKLAIMAIKTIKNGAKVLEVSFADNNGSRQDFINSLNQQLDL